MISFVHMSGAGNCFLVADAQGKQFQPDAHDIVTCIASNPRPDGRPIEGVLLLRQCSQNHVHADFYNPDGSHGMMCGNGARCIIRFAADHGLLARTNIELHLNGMTFLCDIIDHDMVAVKFPPPRTVQHLPEGTLEGIDEDVWYVHVGSDHVVIGEPLDAERPIVSSLRHHKAFPRGVNVNMITTDEPRRIATFERGVEAITGACGTGALSCAVVAWMQHHQQTSFTFLPPSGRPLRVDLAIDDDHITNMTLTGDAMYDNC